MKRALALALLCAVLAALTACCVTAANPEPAAPAAVAPQTQPAQPVTQVPPATQPVEQPAIAKFMQTPVDVKTSADGKEMTLDLGGGATMKLLQIQPGKFMMGSPDSEAARIANEGPQHEVTLTKPYYIGVYEVTQEQYVPVMGENPSKNKTAANLPAENMTWYEANEYCRRLTRKNDKWIFRLPTEAEWEYAARAGTNTRYSFGDDPQKIEIRQYAWIDINSGEKTMPVGQLKPNPWGLYDMHGNVYEWCSDWFDEKGYAGAEPQTDPKGNETGRLKALRSGSSYHNFACSRSAFRGGYNVAVPDPEFGLRLVATPKPPPRRPGPAAQ